METGIARPPLPSYTAITPVTRAPERTQPAAKTELPVANTVTPATEGDQGRRAADDETRRKDRPEAPSARIERKNVLDPESDSIIYVATDSASGEVVRQVPSETLRRLRAYAKSISDQTTNATSRGVERTA